jgi:hypothetical protein
MLNTKDIALLQGMFQEQDKKFDRRLEERLEANNHILKREIRDEFHSVLKGEISTSERRMIARMDGVKEEILDGVSEIIGDRVLPQIDGLDHRVSRLEVAATH